MTSTRGENTRDFHHLHIPHPAEIGLPAADTETRIVRFGNRALTAGIAIPVGIYVTTLAAAVAADVGIFTSPAGQMFATLGFIAVMTLACGLLTLAGVERLSRQSRTLVRRAVGRVEDNADTVAANKALIEKTNRLVAELIVTNAALEKRLLGVEQALENVPDYSEGMAKGARIAASMLGIDKD